MSSPVEFQSELDLASYVGLVADHAKCRVAKVRVRQSKFYAIKQVKEFSTELQFVSFEKRRVLNDGEISVRLTRPPCARQRARNGTIIKRLVDGESSGVEPLVESVLCSPARARVRIADQVWPGRWE